MNKNSTGRFRVSDFRTYYKATIIKTVWYWSKDRHGQWDRIEFRNRLPYIYGQFIFGKDNSMVKKQSSTIGY